MSTTPTPQVEIQSAKPVGNMTPQERKRRLEELRIALGKNRLEVKGKAGLHYTFQDKGDTKVITWLESLGYWIVREPEPDKVLKGTKKAEIEASGLQPDGTYIIGDVILMACPQDVWELIQLDIEERMTALATGAEENFRQEAEKHGVPTFTPAPKGKG